MFSMVNSCIHRLSFKNWHYYDRTYWLHHIILWWLINIDYIFFRTLTICVIRDNNVFLGFQFLPYIFYSFVCDICFHLLLLLALFFEETTETFVDTHDHYEMLEQLGRGSVATVRTRKKGRFGGICCFIGKWWYPNALTLFPCLEPFKRGYTQ